MNKAKTLTDIYNVLKPDSLDFNTMSNFYCDKTMEVRTGDKYESPTQNMFDAINKGDSKKAFLFMGHRGCGKSTELNRLSIELRKEGFEVCIIKTSLEIDMQNAAYWDLLILITQNVIEIAKKIECNISKKILERLQNFWYELEVEEEKIYSKERGASLGIDGELGAEFSIPIISSVIKLFGKAQAEIKYSNEKREKIRHKLEQNADDWINIIKVISDSISIKLNGKYPVIILEDLDKLNTEKAWSIFYDYANLMSNIPLHIIYTFPIALSYSTKYAQVKNFFEIERLPMIKLHLPDMTEYSEGIKIIKKILSLRADESLFSAHALKHAIVSTGGSLRDLFGILSNSSMRAIRRNSSKIEFEDVKYYLTKLSAELTRPIETRYYDFLKDIYNGNKFQTKSSETLLELMEGQIVLEYNGENWHDLHPLVRNFLIDQRIV